MPSALSFLSRGIGVERHTPVFQTGIAGALPSCPSISRSATVCEAPVAAHSKFTKRCGWVCDHSRAPFFRDAKSRCQSELHRSGRGGSTPPSRRGHRRRPSGLPTLTVKSRLLTGENSVRIRGDPPFRIRGEIMIILRFERRVCRWESCRMHQFTGMWFNPNSRGSRLRIWQPWGCKSLHAHHFAQVVQRRDGALKTRTVPVRNRPRALPQTRV